MVYYSMFSDKQWRSPDTCSVALNAVTLMYFADWLVLGEGAMGCVLNDQICESSVSLLGINKDKQIGIKKNWKHLPLKFINIEIIESENENLQWPIVNKSLALLDFIFEAC